MTPRAFIVAACVLLAGCAGGARDLPPSPDLAPGAYVDSTAELSPVRYAGAQVTLNDRCPVRLSRLNTKLKPLLVK
jgi:hypothetical protein